MRTVRKKPSHASLARSRLRHQPRLVLGWRSGEARRWYVGSGVCCACTWLLGLSLARCIGAALCVTQPELVFGRGGDGGSERMTLGLLRDTGGRRRVRSRRGVAAALHRVCRCKLLAGRVRRARHRRVWRAVDSVHALAVQPLRHGRAHVDRERVLRVTLPPPSPTPTPPSPLPRAPVRQPIRLHCYTCWAQ